MTSSYLGKKLLRWAQYLFGVLVIFGFLAGWVLAIGVAFDLRDLYAARTWSPKQAVITLSYVRRVREFMNRPSWHAEIAGRLPYADRSRTPLVQLYWSGPTKPRN